MYSLFSTSRRGEKALLCLFIAVVLCCSPCFAQTFTDQTAALMTGGSLQQGWRPAWGDYNADGYVDFLYGERVVRNNGPDTGGNWSFTDVAGPAQGVWGDYDNDGDLDIYSSDLQQISRYDGGTTFTPVSVPVISGSRYGAAWGDWDNDSYLDLYVVGGGGSNEVNAVLQGSFNGTFTTAWTSGANNSRAVTSTDVDRDGDQDVYVSNYWQPNKFYNNPGVIGGSEWPIDGRGLQESPTGYTSGSSFGDFDNDGNMDAVTGNLDHGPQHSSSVYRNLGPSGSYQFTEEFGFVGDDYQEAYNSPSLGDYDNDGDLDILMTVWQNYGNAARLYRNDGNWNFTNVTAGEGLPTNMGTSGGNEGAAWADFDNDGDLDLLAGDRIWENAGNSNHWLKVKLTGDGTTVNKAAIGSSVRVTVNGQTMTRQVEGGTGLGYQNELTLHFGLGSHSGPVDLEITPPGGQSWTVQGVAVDQTLAYEVTVPEVQTPGRIPPNKILVSAVGSEWYEFGSVNVVYDGSGLTDGLHDADMANSWGAGAYPSVTPDNGINEGNNCMNYAQFSFDQAYLLDGLNIWSLGDWMGGGGAYRMGPKNVLIEYSMVDDPSTPADWTDWYSGTFDEQAGTPTPWPMTQTLDLTDITAKHIAISLLDSWLPDINSYVGLSEIQFLLVPDDLPGDVNGDGWVGGDDLSIILTNWGLSGQSREQGDLTGEGFIGGDDYSEVLTYWGTGTPPDSLVTSIPEPATLALLLLGALAMLRRGPQA